MIHIVDAIMGSGKTEAAIKFMNDHPDRKYLYVTPFIDETYRIGGSCDRLDFHIPEKDQEHGWKKSNMFKDFLRSNENIACTHELYKRSDKETVDLIKNSDYTVIIDEVIDVLEGVDTTESDFKVLRSSGLLERVKDENNRNYDFYKKSEHFDYDDGVFSKIVNCAETGRLVSMNSDGGQQLVYWVFPKELFEVKNDVYVLCYMFDGSILRAYFDLMRLPYDRIGVQRVGSRWNGMGIFEFSDTCYMPSYISHLREMIHIYENPRFNAVGNSRTALSATWFKNHSADSAQIIDLKNNIYNFFNNFERKHGKALRCDEKLWTVFKKKTKQLQGRGYTKRHIGCSVKATNRYRDSIALVYAVNMFLQPDIKKFFSENQIEIDEDKWATESMIQWIWRSAIRDQKEIWIYIPSSRMRNLLKDWIADVERQYAEYADKLAV